MADESTPWRELDALRTALAQACTRDYGRLLSRWRALARVRGTDAARIAALRTDVDASVARRAARAASKPVIRLDESLPIATRADDIVDLIRKHRVVVVAGETGSGKTTQLPKLCLAAGRGEAGMIGCTQPRRLAARSVARRVAEELGTQVGDKVGFQVRFTEQVGEGTLVKFMTDGILLAETQSDPWLSAYDTIIVDEAHERSLNIDFLLGYLKRLLAKRRDLKLIVTSATIDTARFAAHFDDAPVVEVEGRAYPVELRWRPISGSDTIPIPTFPLKGKESTLHASGELKPSPSRGGWGGDGVRFNAPANIQQGSAEHVALALDEITAEDPRGDVLVFLPGEREIRDAHLLLSRRNYRHTEVLPLYARLSAAEQDRVFRPGTARRVVLATNVAETSLTVPRIRYVIDTGNARVKRYSQRSQIERLYVEPVSQAAADQRKGRCGRVGPGVCVRLYDETDYAARPRYTDPELLRSSLANVILRMLSLRLGEVEDFPFLDAPEPRAVADGYRRLAEISAIDDHRRLTAIGQRLAQWPIDAQLARMLVEGERLGVADEMRVIAAFLSIQDPRERPADARQQADQAHAAFADAKSDFVGVLNLWRAYAEAHEELTQSKLRDWCARHFLSFMRMREWRELHRQLVVTAGGGCAPGSGSRDQEAQVYEAVHCSLLAGLPTQVGRKDEKGLYRGTRERRFQVFPGSALAKSPPNWIFAAQILDVGGKVWGMLCARVEPAWIERQATHLVRRTCRDAHWSRQCGHVVAYEQATLFGLTLVERRAVTFQKQDPDAAHAIFLREALARCEIDARADFVRANARVLAEAGELQHRQRRQGLLKSDEERAHFFDGKLPPDIASARALDAWYRKASPAIRAALHWSLADVLASPAADDATAFPAVLEPGGQRYRLEYRFVPGDAADGVTLHLPLALLNAFPAEHAEWLVPGMCAEKVAEMIRGLPKALRRNFVPAPDFARAFVEAETPREQPLVEALAGYLRRITGVTVEAADFAAVELPPHLHLRFLLHDERGKTLDESRDLTELRTRWQGQAHAAFSRKADAELTREDVVTWDFDEIPLRVHSPGGLDAFPALVDLGEAVALRVFARADEAAAEHPHGVERLLRNALTGEFKRARRQLPIGRELALRYVPFGDVDALRADLVEGGFADLVATLGLDVRTHAAFEALRDGFARSLFAAAVTRLKLAEAIIEAQAELRPWMEPPMLGFARASYDDLGEQLDALLASGILRDLPPPRLAQLPRYLKAMRLRAERLRLDPARDQQRMLQVLPHWRDYLAARAGGVTGPALDEWRWLIEEWRVSLFAQELGTAEPISAKRLQRARETALDGRSGARR